MANRNPYSAHGQKYFGKHIGPTGRKRDEFGIFALQRSGGEINKPYRGTTMYHAYGQEGVKEVKRTVHHKFPHRWVKFKVNNETRFMRKIEKKRSKH